MTNTHMYTHTLNHYHIYLHDPSRSHTLSHSIMNKYCTLITHSQAPNHSYTHTSSTLILIPSDKFTCSTTHTHHDIYTHRLSLTQTFTLLSTQTLTQPPSCTHLKNAQSFTHFAIEVEKDQSKEWSVNNDTYQKNKNRLPESQRDH